MDFPIAIRKPSFTNSWI